MPRYEPKYKIAVSGAAATGHCNPGTLEKAEPGIVTLSRSAPVGRPAAVLRTESVRLGGVAPQPHPDGLLEQLRVGNDLVFHFPHDERL